MKLDPETYHNHTNMTDINGNAINQEYWANYHVGGGIDLSGNQTDITFDAFASRPNCMHFFEQILKDMQTPPTQSTTSTSVHINDTLGIVGFYDTLITRVDLTEKAIINRLTILGTTTKNCDCACTDTKC